MTHRGGLSLSIIIWRIEGGGPSFLLPWGSRLDDLYSPIKLLHSKSWVTPTWYM